MKLSLTTYIEPEVDAAIERITRKRDESRSKWLRRVVFNELVKQQELDDETIRHLAIEGNHQRLR